MEQIIRFGQSNRQFFSTLRSRVDDYFKTNNISKNGNAKMVIKTIAMLSIYLAPYALMISGLVTLNAWMILGLYVIMGIGMAGVGFSIMHDANHGSYSRNTKVNKALSFTMYMLGGSPLNWQIQHNVLHHTYTNISGKDEDIDAPIWLLRFSPHSPHYKIQKYQYLYAWLFYSLITIMWSITKDFKQLKRYEGMGLLKVKNTSYKQEIGKLILAKVCYYAFIMVAPLLFIDAAWWVIVIGYVTMHLVCGVIISVVFQLAHVVPDMEFPLPDSKGNIEDDWAVHQLRTTANFAKNNKLVTWFVGGLNHQIEHHLFPTICHVHYTEISKIVKSTAKEFNVPYMEIKTFRAAIMLHAKELKMLGQPNPAIAA
jgi:linoleoyl-CoA desaturase